MALERSVKTQAKIICKNFFSAICIFSRNIDNGGETCFTTFGGSPPPPNRVKF